MALPDRASEIRQLNIDIGEAETKALALSLRDLAAAQRKLTEAQAQAPQGEPATFADDGVTPVTYDDPTAAQKAEHKQAVDAAKREVDRVHTEIKRLTKAAATATARRNQLVDQERTAQGNPLTEAEVLALEDDLRKKDADADRAEAEADSSELDYKLALAKATAGTAPEVISDLERRKDEAQIARDTAATNSAALDDRIASQKAFVDQLLAPYTVRSAAAAATSDESAATIDAARALYAEDLARLDVELQELNITWQEYNNRSLQLKNDFEAQLLAAGMPQIEVDQALATLEATDIGNKQLSEGELVTRLTQMRDAIEAGTMTEAQGDLAAEELFTGATQFERQQQVDSNTQKAISDAAAGGYLVGPNQKTTDPYGMLGSTFESMGMAGQSQQPISPLTVPNWLKATGQTSTAEARKTFAPGGQFYGENGLPAWADTSQGLDIGPEEWKQMQGEQVMQKVAGAAEAAEAAPVAAPAGPTASGNVAPTINISFGGGAPEPAAPPAAAAPVPPPVMPSGGGGSVAPPAPSPAAPPTVGPKTNPGPAYVPKGPDAAPPPPGGPLPGMGMQKFGPPAPPLQVPRWMRSAQFAGGR